MMKLGGVYTLKDMVRDTKTLSVCLLVMSPDATGHSIRLLLAHFTRPPAPVETQLPNESVSQRFCHRELLAGEQSTNRP
jgi:hypothetical protein